MSSQHIKINTKPVSKSRSRSRSRSNKRHQHSTSKSKLSKRHKESGERFHIRIPKKKLIIKNLKRKMGSKISKVSFAKRKRSDSISFTATPVSPTSFKSKKVINQDMKNLRDNFKRRSVFSQVNSPK